VIFIDKWSQPPRREQKHFAKNGPFEPVWARQETFEDRSIKFGQDDTIEEMNNPGEEGKSFERLLLTNVLNARYTYFT